MGGYVDPPAPGVYPESAQGACHGSLLRALRYLQRMTWRAQLSLGHQRRQCLGQLPEDTTEVVGPQPEVIVAKQPVIRTLTLARNALTVSTRQLDITLQSRHKSVEIVPLSRELPTLVPLGAGPSQLSGEVVGNATGPLPVAPRDPHDVAIDLIERRAGQLGQPSSDLLGGAALMGDTSQRSELLSPYWRALLRHHHPLIPVEQHLHATQVRELSHATAQLLHGAHGPQPNATLFASHTRRSRPLLIKRRHRHNGQLAGSPERDQARGPIGHHTPAPDSPLRPAPSPLPHALDLVDLATP